MANMSTRLSHLQLSCMNDMGALTETGRLSMVSLFRQIIQHNPPIQVLNMYCFSDKYDTVENIGELVLEALLNSNIESIQDLNLSGNKSWFRHLET